MKSCLTQINELNSINMAPTRLTRVVDFKDFLAHRRGIRLPGLVILEGFRSVDLGINFEDLFSQAFGGRAGGSMREVLVGAQIDVFPL